MIKYTRNRAKKIGAVKICSRADPVCLPLLLCFSLNILNFSHSFANA